MTHSPTLAERFRALLPAKKSTTTNDEFMAMAYRIARAMEARTDDAPLEMQTQVEAYVRRLAEIVPTTIASNADRHAVNPYAAPSMAEQARGLGISKQAASERRARGNRIIAGRVAAAEVARFSEAARERAARVAAAAAAADAGAAYADRVGRHRAAS